VLTKWYRCGNMEGLDPSVTQAFALLQWLADIAIEQGDDSEASLAGGT